MLDYFEKTFSYLYLPASEALASVFSRAKSVQDSIKTGDIEEEFTRGKELEDSH